MDLKEKSVFLTGGARGIGRGMAEALLEKGAKVLFCDILTEAGQATEKELQQKYGQDNVRFTQCDVTDADQLKAAFEAAVSKFGAVDICVNNAGMVDEINWERTITINVVAQIRGCQLALEHMRRDKGGRGGTIVCTASMAGLCKHRGLWTRKRLGGKNTRERSWDKILAMDLSGKSVFLTGGARRIGRGMTEALLEKGARVVFCDILTEAGQATEKELQQQYGQDNVSFRLCDVSDADQLKAAFEAAVTKFGAVDICVNNAGILDEIDWERTVAVNMVAQIRGCQLALEHMRRDKGGRGGTIVCTASVTGLSPDTYMAPVYTATKHAVVGFMTSWAKHPQMNEMGVTWRALCPAAVDIDVTRIKNLVDKVLEPETAMEVFQRVAATGIPLTVKELAAAFIRMLQDDSSDVIFEVRKPRFGAFRKRQLVDSDGVSNVVTVD